MEKEGGRDRVKEGGREGKREERSKAGPAHPPVSLGLPLGAACSSSGLNLAPGPQPQALDRNRIRVLCGQEWVPHALSLHAALKGSTRKVFLH